MQVRQQIERFEARPVLPAGSGERFNGYGIMGLPFRSGHVLALRRFPVTSVGSGYTSVWHRSPSGDWRFYSDVPATSACPRYFGAMAEASVQTSIDVAWLAADRLRVRVPAIGLEWDATVRPTAATRIMSAMGRLLPEAAWRNAAVLTAMGMMAGPMLGAGHVLLQGTTPNGQHFVANPRLLWSVVDTHARLAEEDLGPAGPVEPQAHLGDFWIPQRGILAIGQAYFDPFDAERHSPNVSRPRA